MDPIPGHVTGAALATAPLATAQLWTGDVTMVSRSVPLPVLTDGELLVEVRLATVCGSDRHTVAGRRPSPCPGILGHEAVGTVVALGAGTSNGDGDIRDVGGTEVRVGDRIVWGVAVSCPLGRRASCDRCRQGRTAKCRHLRKIGHEPFEPGWALSGCYATHVHLPAGAHVVRVPEDVPDAAAAPAACATATVMAAVAAAGDPAGGLAGKRVLICGAGMLGITATAVAAEWGAADVVVTDVHPERLALAARFGAGQTVRNVRPGSPELAAASLGQGEFDVALEFSGSVDAVGQALSQLDVGGVLVLVGSVSPGSAVAVDPERVVRRWLTVTGVHNYEPAHLGEAVDFLARTADRYPWLDLVAPPRPLDELGALFGDGAGTGSGQERILAPRQAVRP